MVRMFLLQLRKSRFAPVCFLAATLSTAGLLTVQIDQVLFLSFYQSCHHWCHWAHFNDKCLVFMGKVFPLTSPSNTTSLQVQTLTDWFFYWVDHRASYKHSFKYFSGNENCDSTLYNIFVLSLRVRTIQSLLEIDWFNWSLSKQELRAN